MDFPDSPPRLDFHSSTSATTMISLVYVRVEMLSRQNFPSLSWSYDLILINSVKRMTARCLKQKKFTDKRRFCERFSVNEINMIPRHSRELKSFTMEDQRSKHESSSAEWNWIEENNNFSFFPRCSYFSFFFSIIKHTFDINVTDWQSNARRRCHVSNGQRRVTQFLNFQSVTRIRGSERKRKCHEGYQMLIKIR